MPTNRVRDIDRGARRVVRNVVNAKGELILDVGVQGKLGAEKHRDGSGLSVAEIAELAEFGLGQPERSWLRDWYDANVPMIQDDLRKVGRGILLGRFTREQGLEILGAKYVGQIQARIAQGIPPANAESTIRQKGSSTPLIDTNQFRSAITYILSRNLA